MFEGFCTHSLLRQFGILVTIYTLSVVLIYLVSRCLRDGTCKDLSPRFHTRCVYHVDGDVARVVTSGRADNYSLGGFERGPNETEEQMAERVDDYTRQCILTMWGLVHFIMYFLLGFLAPDLFWLSFTISIGFEVYEYYAWDCHDVLDIAINTSGLVAGYAMSKWWVCA